MQNGYHEEEKGFDIIESSTALAVLNSSEIDIQISTAKKFPRKIKEFQVKALALATLDPDTAASMFYKLPRGKNDDGTKKYIEGPSVRLAEVVASTWGNIRAESDIVEIGDKFVTAMGSAIDLESNYAVRTRVKRRITDKYNKRFNEDMIAVTCNAAASIALREAVFKVVPRSMFKGVYSAAKQVAVGDAKSFSERRSKAFEWFSKLGISSETVLKKLGRAGLADVSLEDLETLTGLRTAIKEEEISIEDAFAEEPVSVEKYENNTAAKVAAKKAELLKKKDAPPTTLTPSVDWNYTMQGDQFRGMTLQQLRDSNEISADMSLDGCTSEDMRHLAGAMAVLQVG